MRSSLFLCTLPSFVSVRVTASHTIRFFNYCGFGTPTIFTHGKRTSVDSRTTYSSNNDNDDVIYTFLEQGSCGNDGIKCTTVGVDLTIPEASISQTSKFSVPLSLQLLLKLCSHAHIMQFLRSLVGTTLFLRRKNRRVRMETTLEASPRIPISRESNPPSPRRPERTSTLTVPSYQSTRVASTINREPWADFKSGSYFVKLYPTESEMSVFED
ncbi:hypothetical protein F5146DRAFT_1000223 [Armillaria mellea]|nr:hypothetical protein F5146DRAFT_1000223 [Armillaria mellea]